ncbi:MAG: GNAT family N-acetyltransferase [Pseudomonadota bacterium]
MLRFRPAEEADLDAVIGLLWDDPQGRLREDPSDAARQRYVSAFEEIEQDPGSVLLVAVNGDRIVGCAQVSILSGLSYQGIRRALIEDVRIAGAERGKGLGRELMAAACAHARDAGCEMIELFVHEERKDAHRFYESCGFEGRHRGYRKRLSDD